MITDRREQIQQHFDRHPKLKGYASEASLRRSQTGILDRIKEWGLESHFEVIKIERGPNAGRIVPALVFGPEEEISAEANALLFQGILLFQYRRPERD